MANLQDNEYNILSQLAYLDIKIQNGATYDANTGIVDNYTVGDMANYYLKNISDANGALVMNEDEWNTTLTEIVNDKNLADLKITGYTYQDSNPSDSSTANKNGLVAYCFETPEHNAIISYRGSEGSKSIGPEDWYDNFKLAFENDTPQQKASVNFLNEMKSKYNYSDFSVTGHSKGGNNAEYVAIKSPDVSKCVAFDPPGFNSNFMKTNATEIAASKGKIVSYVSYLDIVSSLLNDAAGKTNAIETRDPGSFIYYHKDNIFTNTIDGTFYANTEKNYAFSEINKLTSQLGEELPEKEGLSFTEGIYDVASGNRKILSLVTDREFTKSLFVALPCIDVDLKIDMSDFIIKTLESKDSIPLKTIKIVGVFITDELVDGVIRQAEIIDGAALCVYTAIDVSDECFNKIEQVIKNSEGEIEKGTEGFFEEADNLLKEVVSPIESIIGEGANIINEGEQWLGDIEKSFENMIGFGGGNSIVNMTHIRVDIDCLRNCANKLEMLKRRSDNLKWRINDLYFKVGIENISHLLKSCYMEGISDKFRKNIEWLNYAANTFENNERSINDKAMEI